MKVDVYVDGSFNEQRQCYGGGFVILVPGMSTPLTGKVIGNDNILISSRNIAGELMATLKAMEAVAKLSDVTDVHIYHDYTGIAYWITGEWAARKPVSKMYKSAMSLYTSRFNVTFSHVRGHSGNTYNEMADKLAKEGTFLPLEGVNQ